MRPVGNLTSLNVLLTRPWAHISGGLRMSGSTKVKSTCIRVQTCMQLKAYAYIYIL